MIPVEPHFVTGGKGTRIATYEYGNPDGSPLLLIHGFNQCHLCWDRQIDGTLAETCRIITLDLRGHGNSDKPRTADFYDDQAIWADDINAIIEDYGLNKPVLAGWSYGGHVLNAYAGHFGTSAIAGLAYVGAITVAGTPKTADVYLPEFREMAAGISDPDCYVAIDRVLTFLEMCFEIQPDAETLNRIVAYNMLVPASVRGILRGRTIDAEEILKTIDVPTLVIHGEKDRVVLATSGRYIARHVPGADLRIYEGIGHCPFHEAADRFNSDLGEFVERVAG